MQPKRPARVLGPYREGPKWRIITITAQGRRSRIVRSAAEAREFKALCLRELTSSEVPRAQVLLARALHEYEHGILRNQRSRQTCTHTMRILRSFLPAPSAPMTAMTPQIARQLAHFEHPGTRRIRRCYAMSTRRAVLAHVHRFYDWAEKLHYVPNNPFADVKPVGIVGTAMRRLYPDEVPRFTKVALSAAESGDRAALGALLLTTMKLRSEQVLNLRIEDLDFDLQTIRMSNGQSAVWRIIPQQFLPALRRAIESRKPSDLVLGPSRTGGVRPRNYLWRAVHRLCLVARVSPTNPRSLCIRTRPHAPSTPRPSRRLVVAFSRKGRMHNPVLVRRQPARPSASKRGSRYEADHASPFASIELLMKQMFQRMRDIK